MAMMDSSELILVDDCAMSQEMTDEIENFRLNECLVQRSLPQVQLLPRL
jgi:hypothetical protein